MSSVWLGCACDLPFFCCKLLARLLASWLAGGTGIQRARWFAPCGANQLVHRPADRLAGQPVSNLASNFMSMRKSGRNVFQVSFIGTLACSYIFRSIFIKILLYFRTHGHIFWDTSYPILKHMFCNLHAYLIKYSTSSYCTLANILQHVHTHRIYAVIVLTLSAHIFY